MGASSPVVGVASNTDTKSELTIGFVGKCAAKRRLSCKLAADETLLTRYMERPAEEFAAIPFSHGLEVNYLGLVMAPSTNTPEDLFELSIPEINIKGFFPVQPTATFFRRIENHKVTVEGYQLTLRSGGKELFDLNRHIRFSMGMNLSWGINGEEAIVRTKYKFDLEILKLRRYRWFPKTVLVKSLTKIIQASVNFVQRIALKTVAKDYEAWATAICYRDGVSDETLALTNTVGKQRVCL